MSKAARVEGFFTGSKTASVLAAIEGNSTPKSTTTDEAIAQIPVIEVPTTKLHRCRWQPPGRHSEAELETFSTSVRAIGITDPVISRPHPEKPGEYELLNGDKRWTVAQRLEIATLLVRVVEANDEVAHAIFAAGLMHSTKPTELQETDIVLSHLSMKLGITVDEVAALIVRGYEEGRGSLTNNVVRTDQWQQLVTEYESVTNLSMGTFCKHRLVWLKVPEDILAAVREGKLPASNAKAIARIEDTDKRQEVLETAIVDKLSVSQIRDLIRPPVEEDDPVHRVKQTYQRIKKAKDLLSREPKVRQKLESLPSQIDALLEND